MHNRSISVLRSMIVLSLDCRTYCQPIGMNIPARKREFLKYYIIICNSDIPYTRGSKGGSCLPSFDIEKCTFASLFGLLHVLAVTQSDINQERKGPMLNVLYVYNHHVQSRTCPYYRVKKARGKPVLSDQVRTTNNVVSQPIFKPITVCVIGS